MARGEVFRAKTKEKDYVEGLRLFLSNDVHILP
jgi:hypothetical protein